MALISSMLRSSEPGALLLLICLIVCVASAGRTAGTAFTDTLLRNIVIVTEHWQNIEKKKKIAMFCQCSVTVTMFRNNVSVICYMLVTGYVLLGLWRNSM